MTGCNWCGTTEVKLEENKPYCPDCASNCKRECTVCHKPYANLKFYEKHSKRCNSCYVVAKTKKASIENNRRKFGDTTGKRKQYDSDEESASSGEEKEEEEEEAEEEEEEEEYEVEGDSTKKEGCSKNEVFSKTTKNVQKASSTPPSKRQLTVMETLQINKMKRDKEAGDKKKKKRKRGKNTAEVIAEKSQFLQQVAEYVSKKRGRGQLIVNF